RTLRYPLPWRKPLKTLLGPLIASKSTRTSLVTMGYLQVLRVLGPVCTRNRTCPVIDVVNVDSLKREFPQRIGEVKFVLPEFQQINEAAYWDYQRDRIYVRSNRRLQRLSRKTLKGYLRRELRPNKIIPVEEPRPVSCCQCDDPLIYKWGWFSQTFYDPSPSLGVIGGWVVRFLFRRYICWHCKATFHKYVRKCKYGPGLCAYLLYQIIEVHIPQNAVAKSVRQLFGL